MPIRTVRIQVIKVYEIDVETESGTEDEAIDAADGLQSTTIQDQGKLIDVSTDYAEVAD